MGAIHDWANYQWKLMREEFDLYVSNQYQRAENDLNGVLLNRLGYSKGISSESLFTGQWTRARKYASEELLAWWEDNGRMTMTEFEEQWFGNYSIQW